VYRYGIAPSSQQKSSGLPEQFTGKMSHGGDVLHYRQKASSQINIFLLFCRKIIPHIKVSLYQYDGFVDQLHVYRNQNRLILLRFQTFILARQFHTNTSV